MEYVTQCGPAVSRDFGVPVLGVCGFSGSGKTTLLETTIPRLVSRGWAIAVVKHDAHGFTVDRPGKDSDRLFRAGATVALRGPSEQFQRRGSSSCVSLEGMLADVARDHDFILVEGHKDTRLPKIWLSEQEGSLSPGTVTGVLKVLPWDSDRLNTFLQFIESWLPHAHSRRPIYTGLLIGGKDSPTGRAKQMLEVNGQTRAEIAAAALTSGLRNVVGPSMKRLLLLGAGTIPSSLSRASRLPNAPGVEGPLAGLLAAHRWNPRAAWIVSGCDHAWLNPSDVQWLAEQRRPGTWAILLRQTDDLYPLFGLFEPQSLQVLERAVLERGPKKVRIADLCEHPRTRSVLNADARLEFNNALVATSTE